MTQEKATILVIDDEVKIIEIVKTFLESHGYNVITATHGEEGLALFIKNPISLVVLDLMLPGLSGEELCHRIRQRSRVPILMLTAKVSESDMITGFDLGADDYLTKPFGLKTLLARIEAILRRSATEPKPLQKKQRYRDDDLVIDFEHLVVTKAGEAIKLTPIETDILMAMAAYPNKIFSREDLIRYALGDDFEGYDRTIDSHIKNLRQKIETNPKTPVYVLTVHGVGYRFGGV